ncbi:DUF6907 domain-containing protein [Streptacidiphilus sp. PAMC 29251]
MLVSSAGALAMYEETSVDDEYRFTKEEMDHLQWIHAHPRPDIDLLGPCPDWCKGRPHEIQGDVASEQDHTSEVMISLEVEVGVPTISWKPLGPHSLLGTEIVWTPFADTLARRGICGLVYLDGDDAPAEMTPDQIRTLADHLIPQAGRLREFADLLDSLRVEDMPDQGTPAPPTWTDDWEPGI